MAVTYHTACGDCLRLILPKGAAGRCSCGDSIHRDIGERRPAKARRRDGLPTLPLALLAACGPVAPVTQPTAAEVLARRALAAALQVALVEACRATTPAPDASPAHRLAWALACSHVPVPAAGVPLPPSPPASPTVNP